MKIHLAENMDQVLKIALEKALPELVTPPAEELPAVPPTAEPPVSQQYL